MSPNETFDRKKTQIITTIITGIKQSKKKCFFFFSLKENQLKFLSETFGRDGQTGTARLAKKVKAFSVYKKHTWTWLWRKDSEGRLQGHFFSVPPAAPPPPLPSPAPPQRERKTPPNCWSLTAFYVAVSNSFLFGWNKFQAKLANVADEAHRNKRVNWRNQLVAGTKKGNYQVGLTNTCA